MVEWCNGSHAGLIGWKHQIASFCRQIDIGSHLIEATKSCAVRRVGSIPTSTTKETIL